MEFNISTEEEAHDAIQQIRAAIEIAFLRKTATRVTFRQEFLPGPQVPYVAEAACQVGRYEE